MTAKILDKMYVEPSTKIKIVGNVSSPSPSDAFLEFDFGNPSCYVGSGTTVNSIGTQSSISGTISNTTNVSYDSSNGGFLNFNGSGDISFNSLDFGSAFTILCWIYPRTKSSINAILSNKTAGGSTNGFSVYWNAWSTSDRKLVFETGNGSQGSAPTTSNSAATLNQWQHLAYSFDKSSREVSFYKDGSLLADDGTLAATNTGTSGSWRIGAFGDGNFKMNGNLAVLKVYNYVLTTQQISDQYNDLKSRFGL